MFRNQHLTKRMYMRVLLNLNTQSQSSITVNASSQFSTYTTTSLNNMFTCMISPIGTNNGFDLKSTTNATISLGIGKSYYTTPTPLCRLVDFTPRCARRHQITRICIYLPSKQKIFCITIFSLFS